MRIAEVVGHRTSQPFDAILAMLVRHAESLAPRPAARTSPPEPAERARLRLLRGLRIARTPDDGDYAAEARDTKSLRPA